MLTPSRLEVSNTNHKPSYEVIRNTVIAASLILAGCQTPEKIDTQEISMIPEQIVSVYHYEGNSAYIDFVLANPLETDFYQSLPNDDYIPNIRGKYDFSLSSNYENKDISFVEDNSGLKITFFEKDIVELKMAFSNGNK